MIKQRTLAGLLLLFLILLALGCTKQTVLQTPVQKVQRQEAGSVEVPSTLKLTSLAFQNNGRIPKKYSCQGPAVSPPLSIDGAPPKAQSLVLIVSDPDAPGGEFSHWVVWNIPINSTFEEGKYPKGATQGLNDGGKHDYFGPCPPSGVHRYFFRLYALDTTLDIHHNSQQRDVEEAIKGHALATALLVGTYTRE
ncbi:YbhB/YbcL family Raf kinase inhibitor-like protein [Candidatus Woesearchaeota archaeon]|nr:YbhB/YbcL family Raf kinase inhibitor-like protein [Candidatus Woesearchaeota archaeon]